MTLADHLARCLDGEPVLDHRLLARALQTAPSTDALTAHARFASEAYVRVPLVRTDRYEARLLCWAPGQSSALHGHGGAACAFRVLAGEATELTPDGGAALLPPGSVQEALDGVVHQVGNLASAPLITLHLYAPPLPVDQPSPAEGRQIVIIGGGWSGTALAIHLLKSSDPGLRVTLVEGGPDVGRGVAYGTRDRRHLLNVPAIGMAIDPERPEEVIAYARARGVDADANTLLSRRLYGDYVHHALVAAITSSRVKLRLARTTATAIAPRGERWTVRLADGRALDADEVVLATGHGPSKIPEGLEGLRDDPRLVVDPWADGALAAIPNDARVLVVGTGLTAFDVLQSLRGQGHAAPVVATSRHGRWPLPHLPEVRWTGPAVPLALDEAPATADGIAAWLREQVRRAGAQGLPWQAVLEAVRPHVAGLWATLDEAERTRFLTKHRGAWEVARHRIPASSADALRAWHDAGWLVTHAGGIEAAAPAQDGLVITLAERAATFDHVVLCTGQASDPRVFVDPLWRQLLADGLVTADAHGLGVLTDGLGATLTADGAPSGLWALGGLQRPRWFESTAVPVLSHQVAAVARALAGGGPTVAGAPRRPVTQPAPACPT